MLTMSVFEITPPSIVDVAEVAIILGFEPLAELLVETAYAIADGEVGCDRIAPIMTQIRNSLLIFGDFELSEPRKQDLRGDIVKYMSRSNAYEVILKTEKTFVWN